MNTPHKTKLPPRPKAYELLSKFECTTTETMVELGLDEDGNYVIIETQDKAVVNVTYKSHTQAWEMMSKAVSAALDKQYIDMERLEND